MDLPLELKLKCIRQAEAEHLEAILAMQYFWRIMDNRSAFKAYRYQFTLASDDEEEMLRMVLDAEEEDYLLENPYVLYPLIQLQLMHHITVNLSRDICEALVDPLFAASNVCRKVRIVSHLKAEEAKWRRANENGQSEDEHDSLPATSASSTSTLEQQQQQQQQQELPNAERKKQVTQFFENPKAIVKMNLSMKHMNLKMKKVLYNNVNSEWSAAVTEELQEFERLVEPVLFEVLQEQATEPAAAMRKKASVSPRFVLPFHPMSLDERARALSNTTVPVMLQAPSSSGANNELKMHIVVISLEPIRRALLLALSPRISSPAVTIAGTVVKSEGQSENVIICLSSKLSAAAAKLSRPPSAASAAAPLVNRMGARARPNMRLLRKQIFEKFSFFSMMELGPVENDTSIEEHPQPPPDALPAEEFPKSSLPKRSKKRPKGRRQAVKEKKAEKEAVRAHKKQLKRAATKMAKQKIAEAAESGQQLEATSAQISTTSTPTQTTTTSTSAQVTTTFTSAPSNLSSAPAPVPVPQAGKHIQPPRAFEPAEVAETAGVATDARHRSFHCLWPGCRHTSPLYFVVLEHIRMKHLFRTRTVSAAERMDPSAPNAADWVHLQQHSPLPPTGGASEAIRTA